jgi:hypothetical protein
MTTKKTGMPVCAWAFVHGLDFLSRTVPVGRMSSFFSHPGWLITSSSSFLVFACACML